MKFIVSFAHIYSKKGGSKKYEMSSLEGTFPLQLYLRHPALGSFLLPRRPPTFLPHSTASCVPVGECPKPLRYPCFALHCSSAVAFPLKDDIRARSDLDSRTKPTFFDLDMRVRLGHATLKTQIGIRGLKCVIRHVLRENSVVSF